MNPKLTPAIIMLLGGCVLLSGCGSGRRTEEDSASSGSVAQEWRKDFAIQANDVVTTGRSPFFMLEPGFQLVLESDREKVTITVLNETETVGGITTRVVEEREEKNGELFEISRNYFAMSKTSGDVFYFGEAVDIYRDGSVVSHAGAWRADAGDAKPGLIVPGKPAVGMRYYQEVAPGKAMDRAEVVSLTKTLKTPAGVFKNCLQTQVTTPLEPEEKEWETYAPGIGLVQDENLRLTKYGFIKK